MLTKIKALYTSPLFWGLLSGGAVLVTVAVVLAIGLSRPKTEPPEPTVTLSTQQTEATEATEPAEITKLPENPFTAKDFAYREDYLTCLTVPSVLGIDVSEWQSTVDWRQVKAAGVEFVMIRVGWRGSEQGVLTEDTCARSHYAGAKAAGLKVGAYFFSQAVSEEEAEEEAAFLLEIIGDWELDMPVVFDWEHIADSYRTAQVGPRLLTKTTRAFCQAVEKAGYTPMIYFNRNHAFDRIRLWELAEYKLWLAQYSSKMDFPYRVDMWQYTESGKVPGIAGNVDINLLFSWPQA